MSEYFQSPCNKAFMTLKSFVPIENEQIIEQLEIENGPLISIDETDIYELDEQELTPSNSGL